MQLTQIKKRGSENLSLPKTNPSPSIWDKSSALILGDSTKAWCFFLILSLSIKYESQLCRAVLSNFVFRHTKKKITFVRQPRKRSLLIAKRLSSPKALFTFYSRPTAWEALLYRVSKGYPMK